MEKQREQQLLELYEAFKKLRYLNEQYYKGHAKTHWLEMKKQERLVDYLIYLFDKDGI